jgi:hypothetical protein
MPTAGLPWMEHSFEDDLLLLVDLLLEIFVRRLNFHKKKQIIGTKTSQFQRGEWAEQICGKKKEGNEQNIWGVDLKAFGKRRGEKW